jgi:3-oxoacyl-[acyl-carrier-protein] synthase III
MSTPQYRPVNRGIASTALRPDAASFKRLAWAFGCAPKGSSEEKTLEMSLLRRADPELNELAATWSSIAIEAIAESNALREQLAALEHRLATLNKAPGP